MLTEARYTSKSGVPPTGISRSTRVLMLFIDGVGVGPDDPAANPLAALDLPAFQAILGGQRPVRSADGPPVLPMAALDARLGVDGLPQSATGQAALLTGVNAPQWLGRHVGPFPGAALHPLLAKHSLWRAIGAAGRRVALANAYPDRYLERAARGTGRMGAIARSATLGGVQLRGPNDLRAGRAASAFLSNVGWREHLGYSDMPVIDERQAGANIAAVAREHDFTVFEYYATDIAGHRLDFRAGVAALESYDRFLAGILDGWSEVRDVLILASDHGNVEDMTTRRHTLNPALAAWRGPAPTGALLDLTHVAPAVLAALGLPPGPATSRPKALRVAQY